MNDIESALREELRGDHYAFTPSRRSLDPLNRRLRARRRLRNGSAPAATILLVAGLLALIPALRPSMDGSASPPAGTATTTNRDPAGPSGATPRPSGGDVGGLPVRGIPAYLDAADPGTAVRDRPAMSVRPSGGRQHAFIAAGGNHPVDRIVVAQNFAEPLGLVGTTVDPEWTTSKALLTFKPLVTDDEGSSTAYLIAWSPTGNRWFVAVTADDPAVRMSALRDVAEQNLPGT